MLLTKLNGSFKFNSDRKVMGWSKDPGPPKGGDLPRYFFLRRELYARKNTKHFY